MCLLVCPTNDDVLNRVNYSYYYCVNSMYDDTVFNGLKGLFVSVANGLPL